jgi:uncharacterized membrane protein
MNYITLSKKVIGVWKIKFWLSQKNCIIIIIIIIVWKSDRIRGLLRAVIYANTQPH